MYVFMYNIIRTYVYTPQMHAYTVNTYIRTYVRTYCMYVHTADTYVYVSTYVHSVVHVRGHILYVDLYMCNVDVLYNSMHIHTYITK